MLRIFFIYFFFNFYFFSVSFSFLLLALLVSFTSHTSAPPPLSFLSFEETVLCLTK